MGSSNVIFRKNNNNFVTKDIHHKLSTYYNNDKDIFAIIGICCKIGIFSEDDKVLHGEANVQTQSAVCSFSKLGIYNKLERNIPEWLKIRRTAKILLHHIGHLYGLNNCEFFRCLMNKDVVLDCVPMTLCPICLSKLYFAMIKNNNHRNTFEYDINNDDSKEMKAILGGTDDEKKRKRKKRIDPNTFNLYKRYKALSQWFDERKLFREATWYKNRLKALNI